MPKPIHSKLIDEKEFFSALSKKIKLKMYLSEKSWKEISIITEMPESYLSSVLGTRPTNNWEVYRKIASAIGISRNEFDSMIEELKREVFGSASAEEPDIDYALSSELWDNESAKRDVLNFMEFTKEKYGIK